MCCEEISILNLFQVIQISNRQLKVSILKVSISSSNCSCFVIPVPQLFKELNIVPQYKKGWEPLRSHDKFLAYCFGSMIKF